MKSLEESGGWYKGDLVVVDLEQSDQDCLSFKCVEKYEGRTGEVVGFETVTEGADKLVLVLFEGGETGGFWPEELTASRTPEEKDKTESAWAAYQDMVDQKNKGGQSRE